MASTTATAARSTTRVRAATRRKVARPPQPRTPEDFFDPDGYTLLKRLLVAHAQRWQSEGPPPLYIYRSDSDPRWGTDALRPCSGTSIRIMRLKTLSACLGMDLECSLRLLTLAWNNKHQTVEGNHDVAAWQRALAGCMWRIGQIYREFTRRKGAKAARHALEVEMANLHRPKINRIFRMPRSLSIDETPPLHLLSAFSIDETPV